MTRHAGYFFFNLALLLGFSYFAFSLNPGRLFIGNDGPMLLSLARHQLAFFGATFDLHSNFQQGIGNLTFPINLSAMPGFWLPTMDSAGNFMPAPTYTFFAGLMFTTVLLVGWNYHLPRGITYGAAWLLTILMFPYFGKYFAIYAVTASSPCFIVYMFAAAIADIGVRRMGFRPIFALALLLGIFIMVAASPAAVILIAPFLAVSFAVTFFHSPRFARIRMLLGAGIVLLICIALGWVEYVAGLLLYSSSGFFMDELADSYSTSRQFASILFQTAPDRAFGPFLFALATFGALRVLYQKQEKLRIPAIIMLTGQVLHAGVAAQLLALTNGWTGPPPIYTEMTFFMLYAFFAVHFIASILNRHYKPYCLPTLAVVLMGGFLLSRPAMKERNLEQSFAMPPAPSAITDILAKEIPATVGAPFNGRVASILPATLNGQMLYSYRYNIALLNDHLSGGLWFYDIPTLSEYSQLVTPAFYRLTREFLTLPNDKQNRSWVSFSYVDPRILRMLGVRFLLSTDAAREGMTHRAELAIPNLRPLHLFELPGANTQGMSADYIIAADTLTAAVQAMKNPAFGPHSAVVSPPQAHEKFVPVSQSSITLEKGGYRIKAASAGRSMLIVPVEYSRCLDITPFSGTAPTPRRVNIALTGLVFDRQMDILLAARTGPFHQPRCRLNDYRDFKALIRE